MTKAKPREETGQRDGTAWRQRQVESERTANHSEKAGCVKSFGKERRLPR